VEAGSGFYIFTGTGQAGDTIFIVQQPGSITLGSGTVGTDGTFSVTAAVGGLTAGNTVEAHGGSPTGPSGTPQTVVTAGTGPAASAGSPLDAGATVLTLNGSPGETVTVVDLTTGNVLGQGVIGPNGQGAVFFNQGAQAGHTLNLLVGGRVDGSVIVGGAGQPATLDSGFVFVEGNVLTGSGTPGATVQLVDDSGRILGSATVGANGLFSLPVSGATQGSSLKLVQNGVSRDLELKPQKLGENRVFTSKNVFNPEKGGILEVGFKAETDEHVVVRIFNLAGEMVRPVVEMDAKAGVVYALSWDGRNTDGQMVASGVYIVSARGERTRILKKVIVLK
jgi:hypothetical protein